MRGLTDEQHRFMSATVRGTGEHFPDWDLIFSLLDRGLIFKVEDVIVNGESAFRYNATSTGRLALLCDAAARSSIFA